jgi:hypothetical protein
VAAPFGLTVPLRVALSSDELLRKVAVPVVTDGLFVVVKLTIDPVELSSELVAARRA